MRSWNVDRQLAFVVRVSASALCISTLRVSANDHPAPKAIRVAIYADEGASKDGSPAVRKCLPESEGFQVETITAEQICSGALDKFDVLIHPGGSGSKQADTLGEEGREREKKFVAGGGGFIGICAGAYLASANYSWSLGLLDAKVIDTKHWARGNGDVTLAITQSGRQALNADAETCTIRYAQGPLLGPGGRDDIDDYELLATFDTEIAENGAPPGVMKGSAAIARGQFGKGRVECFSPHPEKTNGREVFLKAAVRWVASSNFDASGK